MNSPNLKRCPKRWASNHLEVKFGTMIVSKYKPEFLQDLKKWHKGESLEFVENRNDSRIVEKYPDDQRYNQKYLDLREKNNQSVQSSRSKANASGINHVAELRNKLKEILVVNRINHGKGILHFAKEKKICVSCYKIRTVDNFNCCENKKVVFLCKF